MTKTIKQPMDSTPFLRYNKELCRSVNLINMETGVVLKLTLSDKLLYTWFLERYKFWKSQGKMFYDNQDFIAKETGTTVQTVSVFVKRFIGVEVIIKDLGNSEGGKRNSNNYTVKDIFKDNTYKLK